MLHDGGPGVGVGGDGSLRVGVGGGGSPPLSSQSQIGQPFESSLPESVHVPAPPLQELPGSFPEQFPPESGLQVVHDPPLHVPLHPGPP